MLYLSRILVYPIKALPGRACPSIAISQGGCLAGDRGLALLDAQGQWINGKRCAELHRVNAVFTQESVTLAWDAGPAETFALADMAGLSQWFSQVLAQPVQLKRDLVRGYPDDPEAWGPTLISEASLVEVAGWYPGLSLENIRARFRVNLEFADCEAFWEDRLFAAADQRVAFRVGEVTLYGVNPCQRCIVPSRDPWTGERWSGFQRHFVTQRKAKWPSAVSQQRFNHFYRLSVNTQIPPSQAGRQLHLGDEVEILGLQSIESKGG